MKHQAEQAANAMVAAINQAYGHMQAALRDDPAALAIATGKVLRHLVDAKGETPFVEVARRDRRNAVLALLNSGMTMAAVADTLGIDRTRVRQLRDSARESQNQRAGRVVVATPPPVDVSAA